MKALYFNHPIFATINKGRQIRGALLALFKPDEHYPVFGIISSGNSPICAPIDEIYVKDKDELIDKFEEMSKDDRPA